MLWSGWREFKGFTVMGRPSRTRLDALCTPSHSFLYALSSFTMAPRRTAFSSFKFTIPETVALLALRATNVWAEYFFPSPPFLCPKASSQYLLLTLGLVLSCFMRDASVAHHGLGADDE
ncbi:hypothetical protein MSAN_00153500 [Mycena sanguinolenta]|uniref:Uncharacterized protein n=1 Tax=Mycena sanguinolenta TaxID=230812 RepID=A0A8H6ZGH7_9AGAR|nr:hypothetical protein MSAN_00153500 [Mycena sanguinolenta]